MTDSTQFISGRTLTKYADQIGDTKVRRQGDIHSRYAYELASKEFSSRSKETAIHILRCGAYSTADKSELRKGADCYEEIAKKRFKPSFSFAAAASGYAALGDDEVGRITNLIHAFYRGLE